MAIYFYSNNQLIDYDLGDTLTSPIRAEFLVSDDLNETIEVTIEFADDEIEDLVLPFVATIEEKHYYSFPHKLIKSVDNTIPGVDEETPTPTITPSPSPTSTPSPTHSPTITIFEEELIDEYIYDSMEAVSIKAGGSESSSVVGYNDRTLGTIQGVNGVNGLSVDNNVVTLTNPGRYYIKARSGAYMSQWTSTAIYFISGDYETERFESQRRWCDGNSADVVVTESSAVVDITQTTTFKIQTYIHKEKSSNGLGYGGGANLFVQKLASAGGGSASSGEGTSSTEGFILKDTHAYLGKSASHDFTLNGSSEYFVTISGRLNDPTKNNHLMPVAEQFNINSNDGTITNKSNAWPDFIVHTYDTDTKKLTLTTGSVFEMFSADLYIKMNIGSGGSVDNSLEGGSSSSGGVTSVEMKVLEASVNKDNDGDIDSLKFDNLIVGQYYQMDSQWQVAMLTQNNNKHDIAVTIKNGTEKIGRIWSSTNNESGQDYRTLTSSRVFQANHTDMTVNIYVSADTTATYVAGYPISTDLQAGHGSWIQLTTLGSSSASSSGTSSSSGGIGNLDYIKNQTSFDGILPDAITVVGPGPNYWDKVMHFYDYKKDVGIFYKNTEAGIMFKDNVTGDIETPSGTHSLPSGIDSIQKLIDNGRAIYYGGSSSGSSTTGGSNIVTGNYIGDGSDSQTIELGFRPAVVSIQCLSGPLHGTQTQIDGMGEQNISRWVTTGGGYTTNTSLQNTFIVITDTGFKVTGSNDNSGMNHNTSEYYYYALSATSGGSSVSSISVPDSCYAFVKEDGTISRKSDNWDEYVQDIQNIQSDNPNGYYRILYKSEFFNTAPIVIATADHKDGAGMPHVSAQTQAMNTTQADIVIGDANGLQTPSQFNVVIYSPQIKSIV